MNAFDIAALLVGSGIIVVAKMMATGTSMIGVYAMQTEQRMREKQAKILGDK